jgi:hypothetical protein
MRPPPDRDKENLDGKKIAAPWSRELVIDSQCSGELGWTWDQDLNSVYHVRNNR